MYQKREKKYPWILTDAIIAQRANWSLDCSKLSPKLPMINWKKFSTFLYSETAQKFCPGIIYSKGTSIYINNRMLLYETLFKAILAQIKNIF